MFNLRKYTTKKSWQMYFLSIGAVLIGAVITSVADSWAGLALGASVCLMLMWPLVSELLCVALAGYSKKDINDNP